jgi:hypothetical protein
MPEISLLEPTVLRGVVEKLTAPETLTMLNRLPRTPWPFPNATWDVIKGSRTIARPNVPNAEAHIVPRLGISQETASFVYLREKKVFQPTTIHWLRTPGTLAARNAEAAVLREVTDLNQRFDNFMEWCCWRALTGTLVLDYEDVQATVDYKIPESHKPSVTVSWATASAQQIRNDVTAWKRLLSRDARVNAADAWATEPTIDRIFNAFAQTPTLLTDRMRDAYYQGNVIPGFLQLDWHAVEAVYDTDGGTRTLFVPDDALFITNLNEGRAMEIMEGPSADDEAPEGHTGKFSKTWKEKDPSARQFLLEWHALPVITRPEQIVYVADVAP